jgi:hypothetical protein
MDRQKKLGILFIVIGICIPLIALPFISGYEEDKGFFDNLYKVGIELRKDTQGNAGSQPSGNIENTKDKFSRILSMITPKRIPFRFFLAITLILLYVGIVRIDRSRRKNMDNHDTRKEEHQ